MDDAFARLGLPGRFSVDAAALEREYLTRARAAHPDFRHADAGAVAAGEAESALLNEAYATLKDPVRRAEHLLALLGGPGPADDKALPPAFLTDMMDLRERIDAAGGVPADVAADVAARRTACLDAVAAAFAANPPALAAVRRELNAARTLAGLVRGA